MADAVARHVDIISDSDHPKQQYRNCNELCWWKSGAIRFDEECLQMQNGKHRQNSNHILTLLHCRLLKEFNWGIQIDIVTFI